MDGKLDKEALVVGHWTNRLRQLDDGILENLTDWIDGDGFHPGSRQRCVVGLTGQVDVLVRVMVQYLVEGFES